MSSSSLRGCSRVRPLTVYVAGAFNHVNGVVDKGIALVSTVTGAIVPRIKPAVMNGIVWSVLPTDGHLLIGGTFTRIRGVAHDGLASLNPLTGALDPYVGVQLTGHHDYTGLPGQSNTPVGERRMDVTVAGSRLANGVLHSQIVLIDRSVTSATIDPSWNTAAFSAPCASGAYYTYVRDVAFSPDGSYFVVADIGRGRFRAVEHRRDPGLLRQREPLGDVGHRL